MRELRKRLVTNSQILIMVKVQHILLCMINLCILIHPNPWIITVPCNLFSMAWLKLTENSCGSGPWMFKQWNTLANLKFDFYLETFHIKGLTNSQLATSFDTLYCFFTVLQYNFNLAFRACIMCEGIDLSLSSPSESMMGRYYHRAKTEECLGVWVQLHVFEGCLSLFISIPHGVTVSPSPIQSVSVSPSEWAPQQLPWVRPCWNWSTMKWLSEPLNSYPESGHTETGPPSNDWVSPSTATLNRPQPCHPKLGPPSRINSTSLWIRVL